MDLITKQESIKQKCYELTNIKTSLLANLQEFTDGKRRRQTVN